MTADSPLAPALPARYSTGAIVLHWAIALALAFELALGFAMPSGASGFALIQLHKSVGIAILLLTLARLAWRLGHRPPPAVETGFKAALAKTVHVLFYIFMVGQPLTGWALVSTDSTGIPTLLFGTVPWPHLPLPATVNDPMATAHTLLAWSGVALFALHVAGALRHQLLLRDGLLGRIGPGGSAGVAALLTFATLAVGLGTLFVGGNSDGAVEQSELPKPVPVESEPPLEPAPTATPSEAAAEETAEPTEAPAWAIQPGGLLGFTTSGGGEAYRGTFSSWGGDIKMDPDHPESAEIAIRVNLASASLSDATMDTMLQGADFFASSSNPTATWRSNSVTRTGPNSYSAAGTLTLKGISSAQPLNFTLTGEGARRRVEGSASIDRSKFKVGVGDAAEGVANAVSLDFSFEAISRAR